MKNIFLSLILLLALSACAQDPQQKDSVYLCTGNYSIAYHIKRDCKGLNNCKAKIITVTYQDAVKKYGRKSCRFCKNR